MPTDAPEEILLISLDDRGMLDEMYGRLFDKLLQHFRLKRARTAPGFLRYLDQKNPKAILVVDGGFASEAQPEFFIRVRNYLLNGGLVVIGLLFPSFTKPSDFDAMFRNSGISWKTGHYHREYFSRRSECYLPPSISHTKLPLTYNAKALQVSNIPVGERLYQSQNGQAAVAGKKIGEGYLMYMGDVNGEEEQTKIILECLQVGN
ncbi:MAG: hypothetical protein M1834_001192 [Cirrosporium novae-zelandiae]|nr:MAG: hypothetical protein M1834_001192 [Cirrosporium novae-zelandiae]